MDLSLSCRRHHLRIWYQAINNLYTYMCRYATCKHPATALLWHLYPMRRNYPWTFMRVPPPLVFFNISLMLSMACPVHFVVHFIIYFTALQGLGEGTRLWPWVVAGGFALCSSRWSSPPVPSRLQSAHRVKFSWKSKTLAELIISKSTSGQSCRLITVIPVADNMTSG